MTRPTSNKKKTSEANKPDVYKAKRHKFYAEEWIANGLDKLAEINKEAGKQGQSRSELIVMLARSLIRKHGAELRAEGIQLPEKLFKKEDA